MKYFHRVALGLILSFAAQAASACAMLDHADPRVGSVTDSSISRVSLTFTGKIFPEKSTLEVRDEAGEIMSTGKPSGSDTVLAVAVKPLHPGKYKVRWNTFCDCGSFAPGSYPFTVK